MREKPCIHCHGTDHISFHCRAHQQPAAVTDPTCYHDGGTCRLQDALDEERAARLGALEAARKALLGAQERGAALEVALDRERTGRLQAEERVAELDGLSVHSKQDGTWLEVECDGVSAHFRLENLLDPLRGSIRFRAANSWIQRFRARQTHAALAAREPVEGRDYERMPGVGE